jgi:hypothetical protein
MSDILRILHLSDLHFSGEWSFKQTPVLQAFLKDITDDERIIRSTLIVFSCDIVQNPDENEVYLEFFEFLYKTLKATNLSEQGVVLCPVNHDVSFKAMHARSLEYDSIQRMRDDSSRFDKEYLTGALNAYVEAINKGFFELCGLLGYPWDNPFASVRRYDDLKISLVLINTTIACSLQGSRADRGHLAVPIEAVQKAFGSVPSDHLLISVGHHPLTDLNATCCREITRLVDKRSKLHFFGHLHDAHPVLTTSVLTN